MKKNAFLKKTHPVFLGALLLILRIIQVRTGFDPKTGLTVPCPAGTVLAVGVVLTLALEYALALKLPKVRRPAAEHFAAPQAEMGLLVTGSMLLAAGGILFALPALRAEGGMAAVVTGALALCSCGGLLVVTKKLRAGDELSVAPLLPALFFGVFFVLAVYLPATNDPILARYYLPVLASAMAAYAFSQLAGFFRGESSARGFTPTASCAVSFCMAATADGGIGRKLLFLGCAVVLFALLLLQREDEKEPAPQE